MPRHPVIVAVIALSAAFCYAASNVIEQRKASEAPLDTSLKIGLLWHLAHEPMWWLGIAVDVGGFGFQVLALSLGSVIFVQPLLVTSLLFSLLFAARRGASRHPRSDLGWATLMTISLATFLVVAQPGGGSAEQPFRDWLVPLVILAAVVSICLLAAHRAHGAARASLLAAAAGMSFGVSSTLMKTVAHLIGRGVGALVTAWQLYALAAVIASGFLILQSAFQAGELRAALPALEAAEPLVACALGLSLMHERLHADGPFAKLVIAAAVMTMGWCTVRLARSTAEVREPIGDRAEHAPRIA